MFSIQFFVISEKLNCIELRKEIYLQVELADVELAHLIL